jgi:hypothetical protein
MNNPDEYTEATERARLWDEIQRNAAEIRRRALAILEHPDAPHDFKEHVVVQEVTV